MVTIKDSNYSKTLKVVIVNGRCPARKSGGFKKYKHKIQEEAKRQFQNPIETSVGIEIDLFYAGKMRRPDVDNAEKLILDSLKSIAFVDDHQVVESIKKVHDTTNIIEFVNQPILLIDPLMAGKTEYSVFRIHEKLY